MVGLENNRVLDLEDTLRVINPSFYRLLCNVSWAGLLAEHFTLLMLFFFQDVTLFFFSPYYVFALSLF